LFFGLAYRYIASIRAKEREAEEDMRLKEEKRQEEARIRQELMTAIVGAKAYFSYSLGAKEDGKIAILCKFSVRGVEGVDLHWAVQDTMDAGKVLCLAQEAITRSKVAAKQMN
jgi:hypothetical protein